MAVVVGCGDRDRGACARGLVHDIDRSTPASARGASDSGIKGPSTTRTRTNQYDSAVVCLYKIYWLCCVFFLIKISTG